MTQEEFFKRYTYSPSRDRIGGGGFGTVYRAKDNLLHRTVAIKVSEVKATADGQKTFSLKDEFEAMNHVPKHPNVANYEEFYSFEMPNGIFDYAVMQYYPDGNLSNAIKEGMTEEQKEDVAIQLLEGIGFLHQHKVVHRDLKPGNILIIRDGSKIIPLITDFGLSKAAGMVDGSVFSNSFGGGTPRYSSPEQLQGQPLRFNTDLWSYGAILYELFTGTQLFSAGNGAANTAQADMEVYNKIVNGDVQSLGKMPEKWRKVAERCLVVDATKRAKDATELFTIIKGDDDETEITASLSTDLGNNHPGGTTSPQPPHREPASLSPEHNDKHNPKKPKISNSEKPIRKKKWPWLVAAGAVVVAVVLALILDSSKTYALRFSEGLAFAKIKGKVGYIDKSGKMVFSLPQCDMGSDFHEGLAAVKDKNSSRWGYIDKTGKQVVSFQYSTAEDFSEGLAYVVTEKGEHFFIDKTGKRTIRFPYDVYDVGAFHNGMACVRGYSYCFFIDKTGETAFELPQYDYVDTKGFQEGLAVVSINGVKGFINTSGKQVLSLPQYDEVYGFSDGMALVGIYENKTKDGLKLDNLKRGYINKSGTQVIRPQYRSAWDFSEGLAAVGINDKFGYIDKTGSIVVPIQYDMAQDFSEGLACVRKKNKVYFIDKLGNIVITVR